MFPLALTLLFAGLLLYLFGRRGTTSGSFPFCTHCRRNLYMLPQPATRCPECGRDLQAPNAISIGLRQPARTPIILGLLLSVAGFAIFAVAIALWWPSFDASPLKPSSMLLGELTNPAHTARAARELQRRLLNNSLATADTSRLADLIHKLQTDPAARWNPCYGDVLQTAQSARRLDPGQWQRYLQQSLQFAARIRPKVRIGDPLPLEIACRLKAGSQYSALIPATVRPQVTISFQSHSFPVALSDLPLDSIPTPLVWTALCFPAAAQWPADAHPGPQTLTLTASLTLADARAATAAASQSFALPLELLSQSSITPVPSPGGNAERDFLAAFHWRFRSPDDTPPDTPATLPAVQLDASRSLGSLFISAPPLTVAFRVVLRQGQDEWPLARFMVQPDDAVMIHLTLPANAPAPHPGPAEIVCVPEPDLATATIDIQQVWGSEIRRPITLAVDPSAAVRSR